MRHSDFYRQYKAIEALEREELKKAVLAHGGEFRFQTEDGDDIEGVQQVPIVMAGDSHWECNCDCYITRVAVVDGYLEIYGYDKEYGDKEMRLDDVEFGHLQYIIDEIPETDEVHDVTTDPPVNEVAVVSLCREDISDAGYDPEISDEDFQQVASRIGKYLEWQGFYPQFLDNVREACDYLEIPTLDKDE